MNENETVQLSNAIMIYCDDRDGNCFLCCVICIFDKHKMLPSNC